MLLCALWLVVICLPLPLEAVLPSYLPALEINNGFRDDLIEQYFKLGFSRYEILACLLVSHGIKISLSQLKRILTRRGLRRRGRQSPLEDVISGIEHELKGNGIGIGYRSMWQRLREDHELVVSRETVRCALKVIDPRGVKARQKHRLERREYSVPGPNFIWHMDGYDKLKPYGVCIHGCIDGYSRRIMWLEVAATNKNPRLIVKYFIDCIRQVGGLPRVVRADCGTENVRVAAAQRFLRRDCADGLAGHKSFMYGKSTSNQRIEAWWGQLRKNCAQWWMDHFKTLKTSGLFCDANIIHQECLKFCYIPVIRQELNRAARLCNTHRIRPSRNQEVPAGRPDVLFVLPEMHGHRDLKVNVNLDELDMAVELCCSEESALDCSVEFLQLAQIIMTEQIIDMPVSPEDARNLYLFLVNEIENIL